MEESKCCSCQLKNQEQLTYFHHPWNIQTNWGWLRSMGCAFWYIKSVWQSLAPRSSLQRQISISGKLLNTLKNFLDNTIQKVILNDRYSSLSKVKTGVSQGSVLEPLLFLIYINNLSENLVPNSKLFADDTSLFSVDKDFDSSNTDLKNDSKRTGEQVFQWKMNFHPDPSKQTQELIFSGKVQMINHPSLFFNENAVPQDCLL